MKKLLSGLMVALVATVSLAQTDVEAQKQLDVIRDGLDNAQYQIRSLRVMPGGTVTLPAGAITSSAISNGAITSAAISNGTVTAADQVRTERKSFVTVLATNSTWAGSQVGSATVYTRDADGNSVTGRVLMTLWTSATAFGAPSATSTGVTVIATGTTITSTNANTQVIRVLSNTDGTAIWTIGTAATGQFHVVASVGDSVSSAAINLQ